jgi:hypothetical protein
MPRTTAAFQVSPRFEDKVVVLNSCVNGCWGREERNPGFPLRTGTDNEIKIACKENHYEVCVIFFLQLIVNIEFGGVLKWLNHFRI